LGSPLPALATRLARSVGELHRERHVTDHGREEDPTVVFENLSTYGEGPKRHMKPVPKEKVLELWKRLIDGDIEGVLREPWQAGYGS
jgi:hypothetical protein